MDQVPILPHHKAAIERIAARYGSDSAFDGVIIGGSVVKGLARPDSDIDVMLVARSEDYARRAAGNDFWVFDRDIAGYAGGYMDAKVIDRAFLEDVEQRGSEPARWAFSGALVVAARASYVADLVARIPVYGEAQREPNMRSFYAQVQVQNWYLHEAYKRGDRYLTTRSASQIVLFAGRAILAYNRMLFPFHKHFMEEVRRAPEKPDGFLALADTLLRDPVPAAGDAVRDALDGWHDWGMTWDDIIVQFMRDTEWTWREGWAPLDDR